MLARVTSVLVASIVTALTSSPSPAHDPPLPEPDTSAMADPVRRGIAAYRERVEALASTAEADAGTEAALAHAYGQLGQIYHAHALTEAALAAYRNARRLDPGAHRWAYYEGALLHTGGDLDGAERALAAAQAAAPDDLPTLLRLGQVALAAHRLDQAEHRFRCALELDASSAAAWFGLGQVASERREPSRAVEAFQRVLALQPEATIVHYPLALAYRGHGDLDRAQTHLARRGETAVRSPDPLLRELSTLGKISALQVVLADAGDASVPARDLIGFAIDQLRDVEDASEYLAAAVATGEGAALPVFGRARVQLVIGALDAARGSHDRAERALELAVALAPELSEAGVRLGNLFGRQKRFAEAIVRYDAVLAREPTHAEALLGRADALAASGRDREALADLEQLDEVTPGQGRVALRAAAALERLGRDAEALARYREAAAHGATDQQTAAAHAGAGRLLLAAGALEEAREALGSAARLDSTRPEPLLGLGNAAARLGRYEESAESYRRAAVLDADNAAARVGEASALVLARRWVEARSRLEGAVRVMPEASILRHLLARLLAACPDRSLRDGERAVTLAEALVREQPTAPSRETLAMALAESGRFAEAARLQSALLADSVNRAGGVAGDARERWVAHLARYQSGESCCATSDPALLLP